MLEVNAQTQAYCNFVTVAYKLNCKVLKNKLTACLNLNTE